MQLTPERFKQLVANETGLEVLEEYERIEEQTGKKHTGCIVANHNIQEVFEIDYTEIIKNAEANWPQIMEVLSRQRAPKALGHMTRIVGYYSYLENWNQSKIGELNDRHSGDYSVKNIVE